ncbi:hypothetical protein ACFL0J_05175 [Candidatus Neomarinimicrobiota bacterium]
MNNSDIIVFEDINFENLVREAINKQTGQLTTSEVISIIELRGFGRDIKSIKGIEHCTGLKKLYLSTNKINDITYLENLVNLEELGLLYNQISDLTPLNDLINLSYLGIQTNNLIYIDALTNLTNLHLLKIGNNHITDINPLVQNQGFGANDKINLVGNPLNDISINKYIPQLRTRGVIVVY